MSGFNMKVTPEIERLTEVVQRSYYHGYFSVWQV